MKVESTDQYLREKEIEFEGYKYLVRDNGAVFRKHKPGRRRSKYDEIWTFGRRDKSTGYMLIGSHIVHRIVAFAFHGSPPPKRNIVDHIDRDRSNNCAANLRWVSQLDNMLRHPSFRKRIEKAYGSLDRFFEDHQTVIRSDPSIDWVRYLSKEEVQRSREQLNEWAEDDGRPKNDFVSRVYGTRQAGPPIPEPQRDVQSLTPTAVQRRWKTPSEFPLCPSEIGANALVEYCDCLKDGVVFSRNQYGESTVISADLSESSESLVVLCKHPGGVKNWALAGVSVEDRLFVHENLGSFFTLDGATKQYFLKRGLKWEGGDSIDDYC